MRKFTGDLPCCRIRHLDIDPLREPVTEQHGLIRISPIPAMLQILISINILHAIIKKLIRMGEPPSMEYLTHRAHNMWKIMLILEVELFPRSV